MGKDLRARRPQMRAARFATIKEVGGDDPETAVRIVRESRAFDQNTRNRDVLIRYLEGWTCAEVGEHFGISKGRAAQIVSRAVRVLRGERVASMAGRPIIDRLSIAAQNGLKNGTDPDGPLTDEAVREWLTENGPRALLKIPNIGPKTQEEICKAFGFDPAERREGPAPASAYTLAMIDADSVEEAIGIVNGSRHCQATPRDRDVIIRHLRGETFREAGAAHGITAARASALVKRASEEIYREKAAKRDARSTIYRLSWRAQNALDDLQLRRDAHVTIHLRLFGDTQLLKRKGVGPGVVREIFQAFGFDPEADRHPFVSEEARKTVWSEAELEAARDASRNPARDMRGSALCACFSCVTLFPTEWLFGEHETAWCPCCGAATVLPGDKVPGVSNVPFLRAMQGRWAR